jgi:hypothetical protein
MAKVQGEGDYEAARRYNAGTRKFMKKAGATATKGPKGGLNAAAERKAKSKSKGGAQDSRDAKLFRTLETRRAKAPAKSRARA